jgi:F0F1-type ATP synthase membrane subunit b/b'
MHEHIEIPWSELVIPQIVNFGLFLALIIFVLRKPLAAHFNQKAEQFSAQRKQAEAAKAEAEKKHALAQSQLKELETGHLRAIEEAKKEAAQLKNKMIIDASDAASRIGEDTAAMVHFEYQRAMLNLKTQVIGSSVQEAESTLRKKIDAGAKTRLNNEFNKKLEAVR